MKDYVVEALKFRVETRAVIIFQKVGRGFLARLAFKKMKKSKKNIKVHQQPTQVALHILNGEQQPSQMAPHIPKGEQQPNPVAPYIPKGNQQPCQVAPHIPKGEQQPNPMAPYIPKWNQQPCQVAPHIPKDMKSVETQVYQDELPESSEEGEAQIPVAEVAAITESSDDDTMDIKE